ncbi:MAG: serine hydrolase domain-containing protein, partial [Bacteroidota bacterium]
MKGYIALLIGLFLSSCANGQVKKAENGIDHSTVEITDKQSKLIFKNARQFPNNTELSIAFIHQGKTKFVGVKRMNDTIKIRENHQSIFEIGSISKVFTSSLLSSFILNKALSLEDPIQDHLELMLKTDDKITFKELANHTSGLPRLPSNLDLLAV